MSEHEHDGVLHTHDGPEGAFYGTHTHNGFEHTHDRDDSDLPEWERNLLATGNSDTPAEASDIVEPPAPKRQVAVIINGVNHGMRDAEEGE